MEIVKVYRCMRPRKRNADLTSVSPQVYGKFADAVTSQDHRGTPEAPGRVVTLIERSFWQTLPDTHSSADKVWGVAYRIEAEHVEEVKEYLDIREINGYTIVSQALGSARTSASTTRLLGRTRKYVYPPQTRIPLRALRICLG